MKTLESLPTQLGLWTTPNQIIAYCGYTSGKISVNGVSTILDQVSWGILWVIGCK
jgi:hypothetical protein